MLPALQQSKKIEESKDSLQQAFLVTNLLRNYVKNLLTGFFAGADYLAIKTKYAAYWKEVDLQALVYPKIISKFGDKKFTTAQDFPRMAQAISIEIDKYYIRKSRNHAIAVDYLTRIKQGEFTALSLAEKLGLEANTLIANFLAQQNTIFTWPEQAELIKENEFCQRVIKDEITLDKLANERFNHPVISSYLKNLLISKRKIPSLNTVFDLQENQLQLYPLVVNQALTVEQANAYPVDSLGRHILSSFITTADWKNNLDLRRLVFITEFLQSPLFINIDNSTKAMTKEIDTLTAKSSGIFTQSGLKKAKELTELKTNFIQTIKTSLDTLFSTTDNETKTVDADVNRFSESLRLTLHGKVHAFIQDKSICQHRNFFSHGWKIVLESLAWLIKPIYTVECRAKLFSPRSAEMMFKIEEELQVAAPRSGNAA